MNGPARTRNAVVAGEDTPCCAWLPRMTVAAGVRAGVRAVRHEPDPERVRYLLNPPDGTVRRATVM
jgi:hypothetical protein